MTQQELDPILSADYNDVPGEEKLPGLEDSTIWKQLLTLEDPEALRTVAASAKTNVIRWAACKKLGGHFPDAAGPTRCRCKLCGMEKHTAPEGAGQLRWTCVKCRCTVHMLPVGGAFPRVRAVYGNRAECILNGPDGILYGQNRFAQKYELF